MRTPQKYVTWVTVNRLAFVLGIVVLAIAFATAPMPLVVTLENPTRDVTIYPNVLFAVPLILLGVLLLLYGATARGPESEVNQRLA